MELAFAWKYPTLQSVHPSLAAYRPAVQTMHVDEPVAVAVDPDGQLEQVTDETAPTALLNLPEAQPVQLDSPVAD